MKVSSDSSVILKKGTFSFSTEKFNMYDIINHTSSSGTCIKHWQEILV